MIRRLAVLLGFMPVLGALLLVGTSGPPASAQSGQQPADPVAVVQAFVAAINSGDADAAAALFATDDVLAAPMHTFAGREEIAADLQGFIDQGGTLTTIDVDLVGDTVTATQEVRQPQIAAFGIDRIIRIDTFVVIDGEITSLSPRPDISDPDTARFAASQMGAMGGGGGGGMMTPSPGALPATGSGGLADGRGNPGTWLPLSLAAALAVLGGLAERAAIRRQR